MVWGQDGLGLGKQQEEKKSTPTVNNTKNEANPNRILQFSFCGEQRYVYGITKDTLMEIEIKCQTINIHTATHTHTHTLKHS